MLATNKDSNHAATVKPDLTIMRETRRLAGSSINGRHGKEQISPSL
jgi:hypothetical protein